MTINTLLPKLDGVIPTSNGYKAKCPSHDDHTPSLSVAETDAGRILLKCFAGCTIDEVVKALGIKIADLFPKPERRVVARYDYTDEQGNLLFQVQRYEEPKGFVQRKSDGRGGWIEGEGCMKGVRRVLYRLPELARAEMVYIVAGEKDTDRVRSLGLHATTNPEGEGKWREEYSEYLRDKHVVIIPDKDEKGEKHAQQVARLLLPVAASVKIVRLPGLPPKGDVSDYLDTGHSKEELLALVEATPILSAKVLNSEQAHTNKNSLSLTKLSDLLSEPEESVSWLVDKMLPAGGFSILVAKPKAGKSTIARCLSLAVASGRTFLDEATQKGPVFYLALEEKRSEVKKHFVEMGATGDEDIYIFTAAAPVDALQQIRALAEEKKPVLIIIDPLFRFTRVKDGNDYNAVTTALEPLLVLARETGAHVLCVHHAGKGEKEGGDSILGSTAIFAAVDTALIMKRTERYRTLSSIQRYGEDLPETVLRFDQATRTISLGESKEHEEADRIAKAILACLKVQEHDKDKGHPLTQTEIDEAVEGKTTYKRKALKALFDSKQIDRLGKGGKTAPFRYCLKDSRFLVPSSSEEHGNKNPKPNTDAKKDSCSLVPSIEREQQNKNQKNELSAQENECYSCSQDFADSPIVGNIKKTWEHESAAWEEEYE